MFINDVHKKEEIQLLAVGDLKTLGIKYRPKKNRQHTEETKSRKVFKRSLNVLPVETVTLPSGQQLLVPKIVHELCSFIVMKIDTEGIFRKGGSKNRQNEIKLSLDAGCYLGEEHHEIDIASVLKTFFRELPEPLIPYSFHELFLRCVLLERKQADAVLLACLLLPTVHLNTLAYFMQFLYRVAEYHEFNRMDAYNLAVVIGPTLFPAEEKIPNNATLRMNKTCELFKLLIENAGDIGVLNDSIIERIAQSTNSSMMDEETPSVKKKKKRRSGSLTRMFSGLKKIVTHKSEAETCPVQATPDLIMTPCITRSAKKRKLEAAGMSAKKRQEIRNHLPQNALLNVPFTPLRTPINNNPNGKKKSPEHLKTTKQETAKEKRMLWSSNKTKKKNEVSSSTSSIQRRWSAVSSAAGFKKKKTRNSCIGTVTDKPVIIHSHFEPYIDNQINDLTEEIESQRGEPQTEVDYVRIHKTEYEEIKNRVSAIERRISIEFESAPLSPEPLASTQPSPVHMHETNANAVEEVNKKYVETLVQAEPLCSTTDQLAKRLSRELKIRRSNEHRPVFRSPSARKIGSLRRKEGQKVRLSRTQSAVNPTTPKGLRSSMRRNNTSHASQRSNDSHSLLNENVLMPSPAPPGSSSKSNRSMTSDKSLASSTRSTIVTDSSGSSWKSAQGFFSTPDVPHVLDNNCRASLARLRCQNAGMVMAKARLFDNLVDSNEQVETVQGTSSTTGTTTRNVKIGAPRTQINRIRTLKMEERRKKSMSPRKRPCKSPGIHRLPKSLSRSEDDRRVSILREANRGLDIGIQGTPRAMPQIKRNLHVKSPRMLCKTPLSTMETRQTPMKVSRLVLD